MTLSDDPESRRAAIVRRIRAETGIDEAMIARLVDGFYDKVRAAAPCRRPCGVLANRMMRLIRLMGLRYQMRPTPTRKLVRAP